MKRLKFELISLFLIVLACGNALGQGGDFVVAGPVSEEYLANLNRHREAFKWVYETPVPAPIDTADAWQRWHIVENYSFGKNRGSLPMIADLQSLHPFFRDKIIELIAQCKKKGIELAVVETYRTHAKQNEYKAMGKKYTRSVGGRSKHQYGLAVDVVPVIDSVAQWNNAQLWKKIGVTGERLGLRWGGRWRHPYDPGHFEWTGGLSSYHLASGTFPAVPKPNQYPCVDEDLKRLKQYWSAWETEQATLVRKNKPTGKTAMK